jgi:hypothetical protein
MTRKEDHDQQRKEPTMSSILMWTCNYPGCPRGNYVMDEQGQADHEAVFGHAPEPGKPVAWVFDRDAAA